MAQVLDSHSSLCTKSELSIFAVPDTQIAIDKTVSETILTTNPITSAGPFQFVIPESDAWLDLRFNNLIATFKIVKADGTNIPAATATVAHPFVSVVQNLPSSFIRTIRTYVNNKLVSDQNSAYMWKAYLATLLNYTEEAKKTHLRATAMWEEDDPRLINNVANPAFTKRAEFLKTSKKVQVCAPLLVDLFQQPKLLLPHLNIRVEIERNNDNWILFSDSADNNGKFKLEVCDLKWVIRKCMVTPGLNLALESKLLKTPAKYSIVRCDVKTFHLDAGRRQGPNFQIASGQIPRRVFAFMVKTKAFYGDITENPFYFNHYNMDSVQLIANNITYPNLPLKMEFDFTKDPRWLEAYLQLMETLNLLYSRRGNGLTQEAFRLSSSILAWDLTADADADSGVFQLVKDGNLFINITFAVDIPAGGCELIVVSEFENIIQIDRNRQPYMDYSA